MLLLLPLPRPCAAATPHRLYAVAAAFASPVSSPASTSPSPVPASPPPLPPPPPLPLSALHRHLGSPDDAAAPPLTTLPRAQWESQAQAHRARMLALMGGSVRHDHAHPVSGMKGWGLGLGGRGGGRIEG